MKKLFYKIKGLQHTLNKNNQFQKAELGNKCCEKSLENVEFQLKTCESEKIKIE